MKKIAFICLILSFLMCYMEWPNNSAFLYETAYLILFNRSETTGGAMTHPLVLAPFSGIILIVIALFQRSPNRKLVIAGIILMGVLVSLLLVIGMMGRNLKMTLAALPFVLCSIWCLRLLRVGQHKA